MAKKYTNGWVIQVNGGYVTKNKKSNPNALGDARFFGKQGLKKWKEQNSNIAHEVIDVKKNLSNGNISTGHAYK